MARIADVADGSAAARFCSGAISSAEGDGNAMVRAGTRAGAISVATGSDLVCASARFAAGGTATI
ncbi:MAG: hypothetical protein E6H53_02550 [Betaproteobacteria bacterium]|nr:MAG: hypothetical protein E6H53_02550 [Betaproteobacteria bacterium]